MEINSNYNEDIARMFNTLVSKDNLEHKATDSGTVDVLKQLNVSIENLPQKCQNILQQAAQRQTVMDIEQLDPIAISIHRSREISEKLKDEYEILKLKQKNEELQAKIDRNSKFIDGFKKELEYSKESLTNRSVNCDNIYDHIRQLKQKLVSYEDSCDKAQNKMTVLAVPDAILPKSLTSLMTSLAALQDEASLLKLRADDVVLMKEARATFSRLRR